MPAVGKLDGRKGAVAVGGEYGTGAGEQVFRVAYQLFGSRRIADKPAQFARRIQRVRVFDAFWGTEIQLVYRRDFFKLRLGGGIP